MRRGPGLDGYNRPCRPPTSERSYRAESSSALNWGERRPGPLVRDSRVDCEKARPRHPAGLKQINHLRCRSASGPRAETHRSSRRADAEERLARGKITRANLGEDRCPARRCKGDQSECDVHKAKVLLHGGARYVFARADQSPQAMNMTSTILVNRAADIAAGPSSGSTLDWASDIPGSGEMPFA